MRKLFILSIVLFLSGCTWAVVDGEYHATYRYTGGERYYPYNYYYPRYNRHIVYSHVHYYGCDHVGWRTPAQTRRHINRTRHQNYDRNRNNNSYHNGNQYDRQRDRHRKPPHKPLKCVTKECRKK